MSLRTIECNLFCDQSQKVYLLKNVIQKKYENIFFYKNYTANQVKDPEEISFELCSESINNQVKFMHLHKTLLKKITISVPYEISIDEFNLLSDFLYETQIECITLTTESPTLNVKEVSKLIGVILLQSFSLKSLKCYIPIWEKDLDRLLLNYSSINTLSITKFSGKISVTDDQKISQKIKNLSITVPKENCLKFLFKLENMTQLKIRLAYENNIMNMPKSLANLIDKSPNLKSLQLNFNNRKFILYDLQLIKELCGNSLEFLHLSNIELSGRHLNNNVNEILSSILNLKYLCLKHASIDYYNDEILAEYLNKTSTALSQFKIVTPCLIPKIIYQAHKETVRRADAFAAFVDAPGLAEIYCAQMCTPPYECACEHNYFNDTYKYLWKRVYPLTYNMFKRARDNINHYHRCSYNMYQVHLIIPYLYLSGIYGRNKYNEYYKFDYIIDASNCSLMAVDQENIMQIFLHDHPDENILQYLHPTTEYINDAVVNCKKILVHCQGGISRSATIVIAYMIKYKQKSLSEALEFVRSKRKCVKPNEGFLEQLKMFENQLKEIKF